MSTAELEYNNAWTANVTQQTDITVLGEEFTPDAVDSDKLITMNVTLSELKQCLGYSSNWTPLDTDAEGEQPLPEVVLRLESALGTKLNKIHTDLMGKMGLAANQRTFKDDADNDISSFARVFLQEVQFTGSVFDTDIPKVAIRAIDEQDAVATQLASIVGDVSTVGGSNTVIAALRSLFEQAVSANRVKYTGIEEITHNGLPYTSPAFATDDSITFYVDYSFIKTRSYTVDADLSQISNVRAAIVALSIGGQTFTINTAATETSDTLTKRYAFKLLASTLPSKWDLALFVSTFASVPQEVQAKNVFDSLGNLYITTPGEKIYKVNSSGQVSVFATVSGGALRGICVDSSNNLYVCDIGTTKRILKFTSSGVQSTVSSGGSLNATTFGICTDNTYLYVTNARRLLRITISDGTQVSIAGTGTFDENVGRVDGNGSSSMFDFMRDLVIDPSLQFLYVLDSFQSTTSVGKRQTFVRKISVNSPYTVTSFVGGTPGILDGVGLNARIGYDDGLFPSQSPGTPSGMAITPNGTIYFVENIRFVVRKITSDGTVTTIAGADGVDGNVDGLALNARFSVMNDVAIFNGDLYVCDAGNETVRKIFYA